MRDIIWPMFLKGYIYADEHWKGPYTAVEKLIMQQKKDVISHSVIYSPAPITVSGRLCVRNRGCVLAWGCTVFVKW